MTKWASLLKDVKEKVGFSSSPSSSPLSTNATSTAAEFTSSERNTSSEAPARDDHELEMDFKRYWEEFRSSSLDKEKEVALNSVIDVFCRLVKQEANVAQIVSMLVEAHIFSFVVGRAFVMTIEKLKIASKTRSLQVLEVISFFSGFQRDDTGSGSNLLYAVEVLVSEPIYKQPLLDSGILYCLIHILDSLATPDQVRQCMDNLEESTSSENSHDGDTLQLHCLEVERSIVHITKALSSHPSAGQSLIRDNSLHLLFQMVSTGSMTVLSQLKGLVPLHTMQLHQHVMQILRLLLVNDNGSMAKYIHENHLIKVLLMSVRDFDPKFGDLAYTMGIVELLLECVELSYRPEAGVIRLREDIHNAHGYQFLVQFALTISISQKNQNVQSFYYQPSSEELSAADRSHASASGRQHDFQGSEDTSPTSVSPSLSRLLDVIVNLAQTGSMEPAGSAGGKGSKATSNKAGDHSKRHELSSIGVGDKNWENSNSKVKDLEAIQMLQDIFLKVDSIELQAEVLNRMFKIFSSHLENYKLCQQLRTVPLFILNMAGFPRSLQEIILKILEYVVTVVNCVPEQELLYLCFLLQQPITFKLKSAILSFFVKIISFDGKYKKILKEVGVLEVLLNDLKQHKFLSSEEKHSKDHILLEMESGSSSFKKSMENKDTVISSPKLMASCSEESSVFEDESTIAIAWDCLVSLLENDEANQSLFRLSAGTTIVLPFLASDVHRPGVLRMLSCLITEDSIQSHPEDLGALIDVLKTGMLSNALGSQYKLQNDIKCETFGALWRILRVYSSAQRVFREADGFSLLLTTLHSFQGGGGHVNDQSSFEAPMKVFSFLLHVITAGVCNNSINRLTLHAIVSSQTFFDRLCDSGLLCVEFEKQIIQLLLELALEVVLPPSCVVRGESAPSSDIMEAGSVNFLSSSLSGTFRLNGSRVYNAGAIGVLIRSLLFFTQNVQLEVLKFIEMVVHTNPLNQENLTSVGCVGLLLETINPFLEASSPLLIHALKIVEVLGAYRLSSSELRVLVGHLLQVKLTKSGHILVDMMQRLIDRQNTTSEKVPLGPFVEMDMSKLGHASIRVSLGERTWPPAAGYSFVCWFQFFNFLKGQAKAPEPASATSFHELRASGKQHYGGHSLRIFSVGSVDYRNSFYVELYLQANGVLTLATSNSCSLSAPALELQDGRWYHLAVVHSKPNALAGLFQASVAHLYLDGKLRHTGKLGYSPSPVGKPLHVTIGTPVNCAEVTELSWRIHSCCLFEEVLTSAGICFMYILGRGYRGLFQDADLLQFVPRHACGGNTMTILDSLDADLHLPPNIQKLDVSGKQGNIKADVSARVCNLEKLASLSSQLSGKKLIFSFDGTSSDNFSASGISCMLNLVDPTSTAAPPIGGIPRFGHLHGDTYICGQCVIGDSIRTVGGIAVVLALIEAAETRDMLHMALALLACSLHRSPQNVREMEAYRGYHLLSLFVHHRMSLFDMQTLEILFQIAVCQASFSEPQRLQGTEATACAGGASHKTSTYEKSTLEEFSSELSLVETLGDLDDFTVQRDHPPGYISELGSAHWRAESSNCIVLSNSDIVKYVLLDWTVWVTAPVSIQLELLGFLERLVSVHCYRNHNLTILREINIVQHLLVTMQRGDVEVPVLEKLVALLGIILEDGFLASELEHVVRFITMTFDPKKLMPGHQIIRESMGKHVIVRNMLLEMLIGLQMTITKSDELLEQWHNIVSSKLIAYFLDEAIHPTSMIWVMTLLGVYLSSSPAFALKFHSSGGYRGLMRVLPSFCDSLEIYYIIFCLIFGKAVYPRLPEVCMEDFHALTQSDGSHGELKFVDLLASVISMEKFAFDRLSMMIVLGGRGINCSNANVCLEAELVEGSKDMAGGLQNEAPVQKMYEEAATPCAAISILQFMVDLAKMCPAFSVACRHAEFLENCVGLYFSCVRADFAVKRVKMPSMQFPDQLNLNYTDGNHSSQNKFSSPIHEQVQSAKTLTIIRSFTQGQHGKSSERILKLQKYLLDAKEAEAISLSSMESNKPPPIGKSKEVVQDLDGKSLSQLPAVTSHSHKFNLQREKKTSESIRRKHPFNSLSIVVPDSAFLSEKSSFKLARTPSSSPVLALASWLGITGNDETKDQLGTTKSLCSLPSMSESGPSQDINFSSQGALSANNLLIINPKVLLDIDDAGVGGRLCSTGATAVLDFIGVVLADIVMEQTKASQLLESFLETIPLYVDAYSAIVFQGLCLCRLVKSLEDRLPCYEEENDKKDDRSCWPINMETLCRMIADHVYMGAFPQPGQVVKLLEFLLSMLQLASKDGWVKEALPTGKGLLSITRGGRQLEAYAHALLKNINRVIMYCFFPSFLVAIGEDDFLSCLGLLIELRKDPHWNSLQDESAIDICTILQLLVTHKELIFCPSNLDSNFICCLCINLIFLLRDQRCSAQNMAMDILKHLLLHRYATLEELFVAKAKQKQYLDVLHGGFDKLLTGSSSIFFDWFQSSEQTINKVLEHSAASTWMQYIVGSARSPGARRKGMEGRQKKEMGKRLRDASKFDSRHWNQINEWRHALELVRDAMLTELRVAHQDKYGWILHAESEWHAHVQQLVHERGVFSALNIFDLEPEWQLCSIEGPFRMRKKLERQKVIIDASQDIPSEHSKLGGTKLVKEKKLHGLGTSDDDYASFFHLLFDMADQKYFDGDTFNHVEHQTSFKERDDFKDHGTASCQKVYGDYLRNSMNEASLHSSLGQRVNSSAGSINSGESMYANVGLGSPPHPSSIKDETKIDDKSNKEECDGGEYLIRPYLEPLEKIKFRYNCERVIGLDKHDGIFVVGELCLYVIENFYIDNAGCICEKNCADGLSIIDQALGVKKDVTDSTESQSTTFSSWGMTVESRNGGRAWAYNGGAWGKEKMRPSCNLPHLWHKWKLDIVCDILKRDYQLRPVSIEIFSMDGCNDLLVFHKTEREEVFKNLVAMNLPRNSMLDMTILGSSKQGSKIMAKSFSKKWQNGEISNFQYLMHLNTLAGRGYNDLTQYPVFPWVLADYDSETLDLADPNTFRKLNKPMGCQTADGEEEFKKRYETWDEPDVPKFHYGSHYSSAGIVLFYLIRLPPFSAENLKLQGGQFDHADRLFSNVKGTWSSASGKCNTSDVKELIPEFFYLPEFLENRFNLDLGEKQSGEKVGDVILPPWAKGSSREFIRKHREALESDYVSENLHHWIDLIFGYKQRGKAAKEAVNVFYHYTYEGSVDIDVVSDPAMKESILAQIKHFGQTPKQLFLKPHVKRRSNRKLCAHPLRQCNHLVPHEICRTQSLISQILIVDDKILVTGRNNLLKPQTYSKYIAWGFPDRSLRFMSYDQKRVLSTHENLHGSYQVLCVGISHDGKTLVTGGNDGLVSAWKISDDKVNVQQCLHLKRTLCAHMDKVTCLHVSQPYMLIISGSDDCTVILWDLSSLVFVKQLPKFPAPPSAIHMNDLTGEIITAAGILLAVWSVNGDCLAVANISGLPSDSILSITSTSSSDWLDTNWYATGHLCGAIKVWHMMHCSDVGSSQGGSNNESSELLGLSRRAPEYRLILKRVLLSHKHPVTALHLTSDLKQLLSGDSGGDLLSWTLQGETRGHQSSVMAGNDTGEVVGQY